MAILSWWLTKLIVKTNYAGMVNIIAEKKIMPEFLQNKATTQSITREVFEMINNPERRKKMASELLCIQQKLQMEGATNSAAEHILLLTQSK